MKIYMVLIFLSVLCTIAWSQDKSEEFGMPLNTFTAGIGRAHDIGGEGDLSNIGFDYLRRINPDWEWLMKKIMHTDFFVLEQNIHFL